MYVPRHLDGQFTGETKDAIRKFHTDNPKQYITTWFFRKILKEGGTVEIDCKDHGIIKVTKSGFDREELTYSITIPINEGHAIKFKAFTNRDTNEPYILVE